MKITDVIEIKTGAEIKDVERLKEIIHKMVENKVAVAIEENNKMWDNKLKAALEENNKMRDNKAKADMDENNKKLSADVLKTLGKYATTIKGRKKGTHKCSPIERQTINQLHREGRSNRKIADMYGISEKTVRNYLKLGRT